MSNPPNYDADQESSQWLEGAEIEALIRERGLRVSEGPDPLDLNAFYGSLSDDRDTQEDLTALVTDLLERVNESPAHRTALRLYWKETNQLPDGPDGFGGSGVADGDGPENASEDTLLDGLEADLLQFTRDLTALSGALPLAAQALTPSRPPEPKLDPVIDVVLQADFVQAVQDLKLAAQAITTGGTNAASGPASLLHSQLISNLLAFLQVVFAVVALGAALWLPDSIAQPQAPPSCAVDGSAPQQAGTHSTVYLPLVREGGAVTKSSCQPRSQSSSGSSECVAAQIALPTAPSTPPTATAEELLLSTTAPVYSQATQPTTSVSPTGVGPGDEGMSDGAHPVSQSPTAITPIPTSLTATWPPATPLPFEPRVVATPSVSTPISEPLPLPPAVTIATPESTATPEPTATLTATPEPTATPTATPEPTAAPPVCHQRTYPLNVMLVLDRSSSIAESGALEDVKRTAITFIGRMDWQMDQAGLVTFNSRASLDQPLTRDRQALEKQISAIRTSGGTNIAEGLYRAVTEFQQTPRPADVRPVLVLLTDGLVKGGEAETLAAAQHAHHLGIRVVTIGLGQVNNTLLESIASSPEDYYYAPDAGSLAAISELIATDLNCAVMTRQGR